MPVSMFYLDYMYVFHLILVHAAAVDAQCPNGKKMKDCSGYNDFCKTMICLRYYSQEIICK